MDTQQRALSTARGNQKKRETSMRHIFIINPKAGQGGSVQRIQAMAEQLGQRHDIETLALLTHGPGHATTLARSLADRRGTAPVRLRRRRHHQ